MRSTPVPADYNPISVDLENLTIILASGEVVPVDSLMDADHKVTTDPVLAISAIGQVPSTGKWVVSEVTNRDRRESGIVPPPEAVRVDLAAARVWFEDGTSASVVSWLDSELRPCSPHVAARADTAQNQDGYSIRVDMTRDDLVVA